MLLPLEPTGGRRTAARAQRIDQTLTPLKFFVIQLAQDLINAKDRHIFARQKTSTLPNERSAPETKHL